MIRRRLLLLIPLVLSAPAVAEPAIPVVASFSILADMLREIGGDLVSVTSIVAPGQDAHGFQPRPSDLRAVWGARLVVANGLGFDPWMDRLVRAANFTGPFVKAADGVHPRSAPETMEGSASSRRPRTVTDPHAWQDLGNAPAYARSLAAGLKQALPTQAATIDSRAEDFVRRAAETDAWVRAQFAAVPAQRRRIISSHDAFGYFAAAYGVELRAPQGVSTESEPSAGQVARLIRIIRDTGIRAVFMESMTNPRLIEQVARDAGVRLGGTLYSDSLSVQGGPADTYLKMLRHNVQQMVAAMVQ